MIRFFLFLKKIYFVLLFILLESLAIHYYANSTAYTKVKLVSASNRMVGGLYANLSGIGSYFHLRRENRALQEQLAEAYNRLDVLTTGNREAPPTVLSGADSAYLYQGGARLYEYYSARVVNNSYTRQENYITLDSGVEDGLGANVAILANGGIAGYVLSSSEHYSVCMSVLNRNFNTSGRIQGEEYFGSVYWDGTSYEHVTLSDIPKYAPLEVGDTILTTNYSSIFPPDVMIGTVESFLLRNATYYEVKVRLHADMSRLSQVLAVRYLDAAERNSLEDSVLHPEEY